MGRKEANPIRQEPKQIVWEIPLSQKELKESRDKKIRGTLVLDIDGTLTKPDDPYDIEDEAIDVLSEFLQEGGNLVFCTGATLGRIERSVLTPLYREIKNTSGHEEANRLFERVIVMPENGSALLLNTEVFIEENELKFRWYRIHELHVPDKEELRGVIETELVPLRPESYIAGDHPEDRGQRDYILSWKNVCDLNLPPGSKQPTTRELIEFIKREVSPKHPEINWEEILMWPARTTIDFVNIDSGKTISVVWMLKELAGLAGPVLGFGDLGDEFANVVPTINVNKKRPNEFRIRGNLPAIDLNGRWLPLAQNNYVIIGEGGKGVVRDRKTDREITVLRDSKGELVFARENENGYLVPASSEESHPVEIKPAAYQKEGKTYEIDDAGKGTAWIIKRLMDIGYFS